MKKKITIIIVVAVVVAVAVGITIGIKTGIFSSEKEISSTGKYSEDNVSLVTQELKDITYDRYVLWSGDGEDGEGVYYISDGTGTTLTVYTEEVSDEALETLEGDDALTYEEVYEILADNIESAYVGAEEISREMTTVSDGNVEAIQVKFYTGYDEDDEDTTPYEHWITFFLYEGNLYYFLLAEPQMVTTQVQYNVVISSIICQ